MFKLKVGRRNDNIKCQQRQGRLATSSTNIHAFACLPVLLSVTRGKVRMSLVLQVRLSTYHLEKLRRTEGLTTMDWMFLRDGDANVTQQDTQKQRQGETSEGKKVGTRVKKEQKHPRRRFGCKRNRWKRKISCDSFKISDNSKKKIEKIKRKPHQRNYKRVAVPLLAFFSRRQPGKAKHPSPSLTEMPSPLCLDHASPCDNCS
jgi:hypothetical protein